MSVRKVKCEVVVPFTANPKVDRKGMRAFCVGLSRGSMAAVCPSGSLLDLSPRASCVSSEPPLDSMQGGTLQFDKLVGSQSNPAHLFTCTRGYKQPPLAAREYNHTVGVEECLAASTSSTTMALTRIRSDCLQFHDTHTEFDRDERFTFKL